MGGFGSGRFSLAGKATTADYLVALDIRWLNREGLLVPGMTSNVKGTGAAR
jgi:hypothetical protein